MHSSEAFIACDDPLEAALFSVLVEMIKRQEKQKNGERCLNESGESFAEKFVLRIKMTVEFNTLFQDICKTYFPRWKPWAYTYDTGWGAGGYTNADRKHIYFGDPTRDLSTRGLIIHEICHAVGYFNHNTRWQNRMMKAAELAKNHDPKLSAELIDDVQGYQKSPCNQSTEWKMLYQRLEEKFNGLYWKREPVDKDNIDWVVVRELSEVGVKKDWDEKQFEKMLIKGRKVAKRVEREVRIVKASFEGIRR